MSNDNGDHRSSSVGVALEQPRHLHEVREREPIDLKAAETAARDLLVALGADLEDDGLHETPGRIARACAELLTLLPFNSHLPQRRGL
jgi:GTP cyclohydrolase I